ncbi:hypothetical protein C7I87_29465 [Mesorhizobium sp. SARCC-RB16n]|uniref:DUF930 domain-containing protein n=1 Tax=Mesorhizobium sp. SARCC-RB16n TaxID=2116687 RepID=UPI00122EBCB4|nr:DUF930 domain-containing protein [Mesorhizobium sp. SARCC-RB16n]KAA3447036.1 hypothetical protein C7I87_29465 [Mesorhizobium sp. SARCC-RB16n]
MKDETGERRRNLLWGIPASLILHALVVALLVYGIPTPPQQPQEEQPVNVALVPPPEQPKPKPVPPPKEPKAEKPPEPKAEKPPEPKVEKPPEEPRKPLDAPVLKRVFQYGDKDTGPKKSLDGSGAQDNAPSPSKDDTSKPPAVPKPAETPSSAPADSKLAQNEEKPATQDTDKQQADEREAAAQTAEKPAAAAPTPLAADAGGKPEPPTPAEKAKPKPAKPMKFRSAKTLKPRSGSGETSNPANTAAGGSPIYSGLPGVRKLYSQGATGDALAASSMTGVPRDQRVANLCANVLDQELQNADYTPKWLPTIPLKVGNVLSPPQAAFSTMTTWYRLSFRCEVDTDATRVLSFNFRVGAQIPRSEWPRPL